MNLNDKVIWVPSKKWLDINIKVMSLEEANEHSGQEAVVTVLELNYIKGDHKWCAIKFNDGAVYEVLKSDCTIKDATLMENNKELVWLWTHCRAIGMLDSDLGKKMPGQGSKGMELDICRFTIRLKEELEAAKKEIHKLLNPQRLMP